MGIWLVLIIAAFVTSFISAVIGMGGGITLLAILLLFVSAKDVVPIHGVVQLASNSTRLVVYYKHIHWPIVAKFALTVVPGAIVGVLLVDFLKPTWVQATIGIFILFATYWPKTKKERDFRNYVFLIVGFFAGFLGMIVGATGPFIAPFFVRGDILKENLVATKAVCQAIVHFVKLPLFGWIGFQYGEYAGLIAVMVAMVIVGTIVGSKVIDKISENLFKILIKIALTLAACKILLDAFVPTWQKTFLG